MPVTRYPGHAVDSWPPGVVAPLNPLAMNKDQGAGVANTAYGVRVTIPTSGTLRDLAFFAFNTNVGNVDLGVYSTAATRARLYSTGSTPTASQNGWLVLGSAMSLPVIGGEQYDFVLALDNAVQTFSRFANGAASLARLPSGFAPASGGAAPIMAWSAASQFPLPSTLAEATISGNPGFYPIIIARVV